MFGVLHPYPKRNLLVILAHGLRSDALSDEREWPLPTPHLVELAGRGVRLVLTAATPADPGAMASVLTGCHARQHGMFGPSHPHEATPWNDALPGWLQARGYHTAGVGEVGPIAGQLDEVRATAGVDVADPTPDRCWYAAAARARGHASALAQQRRQRQRSGGIAPDRLMLEPEDDIDGFIAQLAVDAVEDLPTDRPWALFVAFSGPGNDLPPPLGFDQVARPRRLVRDFVPADLERLDEVSQPFLPRAVLQRLEAHQVARLRADYLGRVSLVDHGVGRIVDALSARPDGDRTYTTLVSDRGRMLGEQGLVDPLTFLAPAIEVPLIVAPPAGRSDLAPSEKFQDGLFSTVDVAPTLAALAGADVPPGCVGRSVLPIFNGDPLDAGPPALLSEFGDRVLVETERHKAVFRVTDGVCLILHDLADDPGERVNLAKTGAGQARALALRGVLGSTLMPLRGAAGPARAGVQDGGTPATDTRMSR